MSIINYTQWQTAGADLLEQYPRTYVNTEVYLSNNPMEPLTVPAGVEDFFGSKVLTFLIVGIPYGWALNGEGNWEETWPPEGLNDLIERHKAIYEEFTKYQCVILVDFYIVELLMIENAESRFRDMMEITDTRMSDLADELADYGFTYGGRVTEPPRWELLTPFVEDFRTS